MSNAEYRLHYPQCDDVVFPSKHGMQRYLAQEDKKWRAFWEHARDALMVDFYLEYYHTRFRLAELTGALSAKAQLLDDRSTFNHSTRRYSDGSFLPPPSDSLAGQVILGLFESDLKPEALSAYVNFLSRYHNVSIRGNPNAAEMIAKGQVLLDAAPLVLALPYSKVSTAKMAGAVRTAQNHVDALADEITTAQDRTATHDNALESHLTEQKTQTKRINKVILYLNRRRDRQHNQWVAATKQSVAGIFEEVVEKARQLREEGQHAEEKRVAEFERLQDLFQAQLRLRAPVALWEKREAKHAKHSKTAMTKFLSAGAVAITFGLSVPFFGGTYIANSFHQTVCASPATGAITASGTLPAQPASPALECERMFSAKGPVTITGLLLVMSLLMWVARLQYRIHLSERHLALDASEKMAFAETYLAMKEGKDVGNENEAIVLASLFRPTQDGIIKDDESTMDLSAAALLANKLGRSQ